MKHLRYLPPNRPNNNTAIIPTTGIIIVSGGHGPVIKGENASSSFMFCISKWVRPAGRTNKNGQQEINPAAPGIIDTHV